MRSHSPTQKLRGLLAAAAERSGLRGWLNWHLNTRRRLRLDGHSLKVPRLQGLACTASEPWMLDLLRRLLPLRPGLFVDVGVNLGQTLLKLKTAEPGREYLGFEPNPTCLHYLSVLIREQGYADVQIVPAGLFEEDRLLSLEFFSDDPADASASLIHNYRPNPVHRRTLVPVFRYQSAEQSLGRRSVGLVKIDVEGAELEVLRGLLEMLKRDRPPVLIEVLPAYSADNQARLQRQQALVELLRELDYRIHRILKRGDGHYQGLQALNDFGLHGDLNLCDYLLLPAESPLPEAGA